jgi:hypothetical protein
MSTPDTLARELGAIDDALAGLPVDPDLTDLAALAVAVRDERPLPDPAFVRALDARAERGFPPAPRRSIKWPRLTLPALGLAASALLVVGIVVALPRGSDDGGASGGGGGSKAADSAASEGRPTAGRNTPTDTIIAGGRRRSVERSAELTLATRPGNINRAASQIARIADELGGYVDSSRITSRSRGEFSLRVPVRRLGRALSRLSAVATVRRRTQYSQDYTGGVRLFEDRLKDARAERESLLRQLARAITPNQTASIRARLRIVSRQIVGTRRELLHLYSIVRRSSIHVTLVADRRAGATTPKRDDSGWTPGDALDDALRVLEVSVGVLVVAAAVALPLGLVALIVWLGLRQAARRRRERALDAV